jgi:hypothetical protein
MPDSAVLADVRGTMKGNDAHAQSSGVAAVAGHRAILGSHEADLLATAGD